MRYVIPTFCLFVVPFIVFGKKKKKVYHADDLQYAINVREHIYSLKKAGIDTILVFNRGCSGCIPGTISVARICWKNKGADSCIVVTNYGNRTPAYQAENVFDFFFRNENSIRTEHPANGIFVSHYHYIDLALLINGNEYYKVHIPEHYVELNDTSCLGNYIYRLEYSVIKDHS